MIESLHAVPVLLRTPRDLVSPDGWEVDALVLPGGESSTMDRLLRLYGLAETLRSAILDGVPTLATCAGLVVLAQGIKDPAPGQQGLGVLDVDVQRNAFGRQLESSEVVLATSWGEARVAFIRAPAVRRVGPGVDVIAEHQGRVVGVRQGSVTAVAFHPELTGETAFHRRLLEAAAGGQRPANRSSAG